MKEELNIMIEQDKKDVIECILRIASKKLLWIMQENNYKNRNWQQEILQIIDMLKNLIEYDHQDLPS